MIVPPTNKAGCVRLGFSTNCLYKTGLKNAERLDFFRDCGLKIVEIGPIKPDEFWDDIPDIRRHDLAGFEYVSLHAPKMIYGFNDETLSFFRQVDRLHSIRPLDLVIVHPDMVDDFFIFRTDLWPKDLELAFENMDNKKMSHRNVREMAEIEAKIPNFSIVLDVNHAFSNDPTTKLTEDLYERFRNRIVQIHLSGYDNGHAPLFQTEQAEIIESIRDTSVPIIVESVLEADQIAFEHDYILKQLKLMNRA